MTRGQRLAVVIGSVALILVIGRGAVVLYVDHAWYSALDASAIWASKVTNTMLLYGGALLVGAAFAFANLLAVRKSIMRLTLPTRVGNIEIGETVSPSRLIYVTGAMSLCASAFSLLALPRWTTLALWRSPVMFGEIDPFFRIDLSFYVAWLPLEIALYNWTIVVYAIVTLLVITIYALTPSLRWTRNRILISTYARRHIGILMGLCVALIAWSMRLNAYHTMTIGNGPNGLITYFDHQWLIPTNAIVSLVILGAALVLVIAIWLAQTQTALIVVSALILTLVVVQGVFPWLSARDAQNPATKKYQASYAETQRLYTKRAFPPEPELMTAKYEADSTILANAPNLQIPGGMRDIVYPGARGVVIERDSANEIKAPRVGSMGSRIMTAWAEQNPRLLRRGIDPNAALIRHRDVRERVRIIAPIFAQSQKVGVRPTPHGVTWIIDLYTTSMTFPMSIARPFGPVLLTARRHVGTAYVNGSTGSVTIVPNPVLGPVSRWWFRTHRGAYLATQSPLDTGENAPIIASPNTGPSLGVTDSAFKERVTNLYLWMRSRLNAGDLKGFGDAFDSLGNAVGVPR